MFQMNIMKAVCRNATGLWLITAVIAFFICQLREEENAYTVKYAIEKERTIQNALNQDVCLKFLAYKDKIPTA